MASTVDSRWGQASAVSVVVPPVRRGAGMPAAPVRPAEEQVHKDFAIAAAQGRAGHPQKGRPSACLVLAPALALHLVVVQIGEGRGIQG